MARRARLFRLGRARARFRGIRFRLALAMALALLPVLGLGAIQAQAAFREQAQDRRDDLQLAVERTAATAKGRLDSAGVLLQALRHESGDFYCEARLTDITTRVQDVRAVARINADGGIACASRGAANGAAWLNAPTRQMWWNRLKAGESTVLARAPGGEGGPALIVAIRLERPMGGYDGAMTALVPLSVLQPDIADPALPDDSRAALTDASGRLLTATQTGAFTLQGGRNLEGWVDRARAEGRSIFEARDVQGRRRVYAGAALAGRDVYALISAPAPDLLSWAVLNPVGSLLFPLLAWLIVLAAVMLVSERLVVRWLTYLEQIAATYTRGRFDVRPVQAVNAPTEIRKLAAQLDEMGESVIARDAALTASLAEKDALMREIHHRVKNNLQIISSLLSMQQRTVDDPSAKSALGDTRQRITALALIYRTLYQSDDLRWADARTFLTDLVGQLIAGEAARGRIITTSVQADSLVVDPDKLAPLALWLVEAVTNAQKHAFAENGGDMQVRFTVDGDTSVLEVQDNGPGVDAERRAGVGRTLMNAFAKQLRGQLELIPVDPHGTIARLTFATPEALTPVDPTDLGTGGDDQR